MNPHIKYLKQNQLTQVLADGFAHIYHDNPKFPISYLANYLKNYNKMKQEQQKLIAKQLYNHEIVHKIQQQEEKIKKQKIKQIQLKQKQEKQLQMFITDIKNAQVYQDVLDKFCQGIQKKYGFTGVYLGELEYPTKQINLDIEDSEDAHILVEAPKLIKFKAASNSHRMMIKKTLSQDSVLGKLLSQKTEAQPQQQQEGDQKPKKLQGQIYIPSVVESKQLYFFKYPRLGSFYSVQLKVKTFLYQKIFDTNLQKIQIYKKSFQQYQKQQQEKQTKFRQLYQQKVNAGTDQKQLEEMEKTFEKQQKQIPQPQLQEFQSIGRAFVVCFDTLGQDCGISEDKRQQIKGIVNILKNSWENKQKQLLKSDINIQIKQLQSSQIPQQQILSKLIQQQQKQLPGSQEVQKYKDNQKLMELQLDTLRIQKIKQYLIDQKYTQYLDTLLSLNVIKYSEILRCFLYFLSFDKNSVNFKGTNIIEWGKAKKLIKEKQKLFETITTYNVRGSKLGQVLPYAKWERIQKNIQKYDLITVATYNLYLGFIFRFLTIAAKVRKADREARLVVMKQEILNREQRIQQKARKDEEKIEKMKTAKLQCQQKQQAFDESAWEATYDQQNPPIQVGDQIENEIDRDLQQGQIPLEIPIQND